MPDIIYIPPSTPVTFADGLLKTASGLSATLQTVTDYLGTSSPMKLSTARVALGTSTGTSLLNFPDAGTTAANGISFGTGTSNLYRSAANTLKSDGNFIANLVAGSVVGGVTMTLGSDDAYDTYYRNSLGVLTRLANGTTGQVLTASTGSVPSWTTPGTTSNGYLYPATALNTTPSLIKDQAGTSSIMSLGTTRMNLGTSTGIGLLNFPDAGTSASDGIYFGTEHQIYRLNSSRLNINAAAQLFLSTAGTTRVTLSNATTTISNDLSTAGRVVGPAAVTVASANNLQLTTGVGNIFHISGTTSINTLDSSSWGSTAIIWLIFDNSLTVANNGTGSFTKFSLAGATNFNATSNDVLTLLYDSGSSLWREVCRSVN